MYLHSFTPTLIPTCKRTVCPCTPYLHLYPRKSTFTSTYAQAHTSILSFSFPNLSTISYFPCTPHHIHTYTSTRAHTFSPLIFTLGLLFHSDFSFLTRLCPLYEPGVLGHSLPHRIDHPAPVLGWPRLGDFFTNRVLDKLWRLITSEIKPTEQNGAESCTPS